MAGRIDARLKKLELNVRPKLLQIKVDPQPGSLGRTQRELRVAVFEWIVRRIDAGKIFTSPSGVACSAREMEIWRLICSRIAAYFRDPSKHMNVGPIEAFRIGGD